MPPSSLRPSTKINKSLTPAQVKEKSTAEPGQKKTSAHRRSSSGITPKTSLDPIITSSPHSIRTDDPSPTKGVVGKSFTSISSRMGRMTTRSSAKSLQSISSDSSLLSSSPATRQDAHAESSPTRVTEGDSVTMTMSTSRTPNSSATFPSKKSNIPISKPVATASLSADPSSRASTSAHRRSISLVAAPSSSALEETDHSASPSLEQPLKDKASSLRRSVSSSHKSPSKLPIPAPSDVASNIKLSPSKATANPKGSRTPSPIKSSRPVARSLAPKNSFSGRPSSVSGSLAFSAVQKDPSRATPRNQSIPVLKKGHRPSLSTSTVPSNPAALLARKRPISMAIASASTSSTSKSTDTAHSVLSPEKQSKSSAKSDVQRTPIDEVDSEDSADDINISSPITKKDTVLKTTGKVMPKSPLKGLNGDGVDCASSQQSDVPFPSLYSLNQSSSSQMLKDLLTPSAAPFGSRDRPRPLVARNSLVHFDSMAQSFALEDEGDSLLHLPGNGPDPSFPDLNGPGLESPPGSLKRKAKRKSSLAASTKMSDRTEFVSLQNRLDESLLAQAALNELLERELGKVRELEEYLAERQIEEDLLKASPVKASAPTFSRPFLERPTVEVALAAVDESDSRLKVEVVRLKTELESSTDCIESLQTGLSELTEQLTSAHQDVSSLQDDLGSIRLKNSELQAENASKTTELEAQQIAHTVEGRKKASRAWTDVKVRAIGELEDLKGERDLLAVLETILIKLEREASSRQFM